MLVLACKDFLRGQSTRKPGLWPPKPRKSAHPDAQLGAWLNPANSRFVASMFEGATEPRGSVWSARSLLPLWRLRRQRMQMYIFNEPPALHSVFDGGGSPPPPP